MYTYKPQEFRTGQASSKWSLAQSPYAIAAFLAVCTLLIRLPNFGDPTYHIDEAFYLFVGQRMHEGLLPYADIWDRKPAGLFVLFAIIAQFGAVHAYQVIAALFAWGTALTLSLIATRFAGRAAACAVGVFYLAMIGALAGGGGQSPVFYNLFIALAAFAVLRQSLGQTSLRPWLNGPAAMLLCGLALTIKPTALAEGVFLGLMLLAVHWQRQRDPRRLASHAAVLGAMALAPTAVIWTYFYATGHLGTYWFATMQSIFQTQPPSEAASAIRLTYLSAILWTSAIFAIVGVALLARRIVGSSGRDLTVAIFVGGWLTASIAGFLMVPNFYDHYALPMASTLALACAPVFDRKRTGPLLALLATGYLFLVSGFPFGQIERNAASQAGFSMAKNLIARHSADGCIFVFDATPALYRSFDPCPAARYAFPEHLSNQREANAIGADPVRVLHDIVDQRPAVIVMPFEPSVSTPNLATRRVLERHLDEHYVRVGEATLVDVVGRQRLGIWTRATEASVASR